MGTRVPTRGRQLSAAACFPTTRRQVLDPLGLPLGRRRVGKVRPPERPSAVRLTHPSLCTVPSCAAPKPVPRPSASPSVKTAQSPTSGPCGPKPHRCGFPGWTCRSPSAPGASPCRGGSPATRASCTLSCCRQGPPMLGAESEEGRCLGGAGRERVSAPDTPSKGAAPCTNQTTSTFEVGPGLEPSVRAGPRWGRGSRLGPPGGTSAPTRQSRPIESVAQGLLPHSFSLPTLTWPLLPGSSHLLS